MLVSCGSSEESSGIQQSDPLTISNEVSAMADLTLSAPERLRSVSAIDPASIVAVAVLNGVETPLQRNAAGQFVGQVSVPAGSSVAIVLEFYEMYQGVELTLASLDRTITVGNTDTTVNLFSSEYVYDAFDTDGDSYSNIVERENDTSPVDPDETPNLVAVDVFANRPAAAVSAGFSNYDFEVTVGAETHILPANIGEYRRTFQVARQSDVVVSVKLIEKESGQRFVIGTQSQPLVNVQSDTTVVFESGAYELDFDQDGDGSNNLQELIEGTDFIGVPDDRVTYTVRFAMPAEIATSSTAYAVLMIEGESISLVRNGSDYSASATADAGDQVGIDVNIYDTYQGSVLTLASFSAGVQPIEGSIFNLQNFSLLHDDDGDGVLNYLEIEQGTDPFTDPDNQQCTPTVDQLELLPVEDAYVFNNSGNLLNELKIQVDKNRRTGLIRYQYDPALGTVNSADLVITVGADEGGGRIDVHALQNLQWSATDGNLSLPLLGTAVSSLDESWESGDNYTFQIDPTAITSDFTLALAQEVSGNDVSFNSSETATPPVLNLYVERCD